VNIRPLYDRIVVKRIEEQETTRNGIFIPDSAKEKPQEGEVLAVGHGKRLKDGTLVAQARKRRASHHRAARLRGARPADCAQLRDRRRFARKPPFRVPMIRIGQLASLPAHDRWSHSGRVQGA